MTELGQRLLTLNAPVWLLGDGAELCYKSLKDTVPGIRLAPPQLRLQRASSIGFAAEEALKTEKPLSPGELMPVYLRLPQAERELNRKAGAAPHGKEG